MKKITILGSTGSIGQSTLEVIRSQQDIFSVIGLAAGTNIELLARQIIQFNPYYVSVKDEKTLNAILELLKSLGYDTRKTSFFFGREGLLKLAINDESSLIISALVGFLGLEPTYNAVCAGKDVALANKETLVAGGDLIMRAAAENNVRIIPIDSEHSAVFQCIQGSKKSWIKKIWLTASGGPFFNINSNEFPRITPQMALKHPTWNMGPKITIDSATMMNKGLEIIEAHHLFNLPSSKIGVVIHPQSTIHSMVEFVDGSILAQMGITDMKIPIQYALHYPERAPLGNSSLDIFNINSLEFYKPDFEKFPCLSLAYRAIEEGGSAPVVLNASNEIAVDAFLKEKIPFTTIPVVIKHALENINHGSDKDLNSIIELDSEVRLFSRKFIEDNYG